MLNFTIRFLVMSDNLASFSGRKVLILGGYGNFGRRISFSLAKANVSIIIAGRNQVKANQLAQEIKSRYPTCVAETAIIDVNQNLNQYFEQFSPFLVINTCGPFQLTDYQVAKICIQQKVHYIDLADGRDFVNGITALDAVAKEKDVLVVSGASTVPGLSSAVIEHFQSEFSEMTALKYGISPGQKAPRGLATAQSILTYLGKPLKSYPHPDLKHQHYGWQDNYRQLYPLLGKRWMANCDIPDLDIFPKRYGLKSIQFSAGMESSLLHLGMCFTSWLVRLGLPLNLSKHAPFFLKLSNLFNIFGTDNGGMHMIIEGKDHAHRPKKIQWFIVAKEGEGPQIPCVPAIVLAKKLIANQSEIRGALPCVGLITLSEYREELKAFKIVYYS